MSEADQRVHELEQRVEELESIISRELGYNFGPVDREPQTVDCDCGTTFEVNVVNGAICPDCGTSATDLSDHADREPEDTENAEAVLREAVGDDVVDAHSGGSPHE